MLVRMIAVVALRMSVAAHVGRRNVMLLPVIVRLDLILRVLRSAGVWMALVVSFVAVIVIPVMMIVVLMVVPIVMIPIMIIPVVMMSLVPVRSVMPPTGIAIPIRMLATPLAVALFWVTIAVTEIRVIFRMVVTVVVTFSVA